MNGPALHAIDFVAERVQALGDFTGSFVGESEDANSSRIDIEILDQESNALDEAESFAGTGARYYECGRRRCSDGGVLRCGRLTFQRYSVGRDRRCTAD